MRRGGISRAGSTFAALLLPALLLAQPSPAQFLSSTTTTDPPEPTTTTMFTPVDITGGGVFEGGFKANSFDTWSFELEEPRVIVAEITNGVGGCPGDTLIELRRPGAPSNCNQTYGDDLPCVAIDDDSGLALCSKLTKRILAPGSYELKVWRYGGGPIIRYFLHVDFIAIECGNGELEITEDCDDGNSAGGDCCSGSCHYDTVNSPCSDSLFCNGPDACDGKGQCIKHLGSGCAPGDGDADCTESCDEAADACSGVDPNGSPCSDGLYCNGADSCQNGSCSVHAGDPCPARSGDGDADCSESCSEAADACSAKDADGTPCVDALYCNGSDTCSNGSCSVHGGNPCDGSDGDGDCSESCDETANDCSAADPDHTPCDDAVFCNGGDHCSSGECSVHAGDPCPGSDDDDDCSESCDEASDACSATDGEGAACSDGFFCNGADTCASGVCATHAGDPCPGADGDLDCSESCDESSDNCHGNDADGSACEDGLACNGNDNCVGGFCAGHGEDPCPGIDGDSNCAESCSDSGEGCAGKDPDASPCDDGIFCNGSDQCSNGGCALHSGDPCPGADGDADCSESCNEAADDCSAPDPAASACSDDLYCNGAESCAAGECVNVGPSPDCDDGDECSTDTCVEAVDDCSHEPLPNCPPSTTTTTLPDYVCGDVNESGGLTASDALAILRSAVGGSQCAGKLCVCDANGSGSVTAADALAVLKAAVGSAASLQCEC